MITKINIGLSLLLLGGLYFSNPTILTNSKKEYLSIKEQPQTPLQKSIARGKEVYTDFCIQCHMATGKGNGTTFPPLDGSDWLKKKRAESIHAVKYGQKGEILVNQKKFNGIMPPMGLSDEEVADVMNYVMNSWTNKTKKMVTAKEVSSLKP
ncbi:cytochrome c [Flavobacterium sufflavum]|uniref:Cytochrome c n=1 Tax=Flavobacterium sufflavum TaxID=1921138 RepID=A0A3S2XMF7_9FLAO|nr:cytochrome c [Flavobacterium sufflavum]RVT80008.1 cytochrome c [Flavobacterium sufflavum]